MNTINKADFKDILQTKQSEITTSRDLKFFESFFFLNESAGLPPDLSKRHKLYYQKLIADENLKQRYYLFHLIKTLDAKWVAFDVQTIVTHFYKSSGILNELMEEMK